MAWPTPHHQSVDTRQLFRKLTLALLWSVAVSTWIAIGHHLFGLPDVGLPGVVLTVITILVWPLNAKPGTRRVGLHRRAELPRTGA